MGRSGLTSPFASVQAALDRRLDPGSKQPLAVAFSGGGDSLALLHLTLAWARANGRAVLALTVDHGLHPDSPQWTRNAGETARRLGADWRPLSWTGQKPAVGIPAAARQARHTLLALAAREVGAQVVLMGHTADDIAEGELMRVKDAPGMGRLREWAPSPVWPEGRGVFLLRPLLHARREALRNYLSGLGESWLDDPANEDVRHPRIRARRALEGAAPHPLTLLNDGGPTDLAESARVRGDGSMLIPRAALAAAGSTAAPVLAAALVCVSGGRRPPRGKPLRRVLDRISQEDRFTVTLSGCRIEAQSGSVVLARAPPRRGQVAHPPEPADWVAARFAAACGLIGSEAEAGAPPAASL